MVMTPTALFLFGVPLAFVGWKVVLRHHLVAYEATCIMCLTWLVVAGVRGALVHGPFGPVGSPAELVHSRSDWLEAHLIWPMGIFQAYNLAFCTLVPSMRTPSFVAHHLITLLASWAALLPLVQTPSVFFYGIAEASSVLLGAKNIIETVPAWRAGAAYPVVKVAFASSYIVLRLIMWPWAMFYLLTALVPHALDTRHPVPCLFIVLAVSMTTLQFMWGFRILRLLYRMCFKSRP